MDRPQLIPDGDASAEGCLTGEGIRTGNYKMAPGAETFWCESNPSYGNSAEFEGDTDDADSGSSGY